MEVAGLFPLASPTSNGLMSSELATLFTIKNAYNDTGTVTLNIGRQRGPIWAYSKSLGGNRTVCFIAKDSGVDFLGSSLDNSVLRNNITATLVNEEVLITAKTESGDGFVNLYAFYVGS